MKRPFLCISPTLNRCDLWTVGIGNTIHFAWKAPRWLSRHKYVSLTV